MLNSWNATIRSVKVKTTLAAFVLLCSSFSQAAAPDDTPASTSAAHHTDLTATLNDADASVAATNADIANLHVEKWASGWKTAWTKKSSHKQLAGQSADSIKQMTSSLSATITEVRSSHGSVGSTFKLFNNLTSVCENMDALVEATHTYGKKDDYSRLSGDYSNLLRVRSQLSSYIEQRASVVDPHGNPGIGSSSTNAKKTDDTAPDKKATTRKKSVMRSSR
jgi:hypothetical protein